MGCFFIIFHLTTVIMCQARDDCSSRLTIFLCHMVRMSMLSWHGKCSSEGLINSYLPDPQHSLYNSSDQKLNCTGFNNILLISLREKGVYWILLKRWTTTLHICTNIHFQTYQVHWVLSALPPKVLVENCWIDRMEESNEGHNCDVKISISPCSGQCHCYEFICVKFSIRMHLFGWYSVYSRTACNLWTAFSLSIFIWNIYHILL